MINFLNTFLRNRIIDKYIFELAPLLVKRYGALDQYTVPQLEKTAQSCRLSTQYIPYAIAIYRHEESNRTKKLYRINQQFLNILRAEISDSYFDGYDYRAKDIIYLATPKGSQGNSTTDGIIGIGSGYTGGR
ncbi:hypothetical protein MNBD_GAMMA10-2536 [hydrothermal vent metagenome]|uniref:Uncharacterized protein n=1 Tax=hydrothermal vent metagenome TaxID=652676 RepID=A0A3B0Y764_9ZZZZ